jgi:Pyruvate/2-oxoacid:ferredoxin oxidoreductase delta subunit
MQCKIFYFTSTGTSLHVARQIADGIGGAELVAIPQAMERHVTADEPAIGLAFPVYAWGMPRMVEDFVRGLKLSREQYVFAVATCGGTPATTLLRLRDLLREGGVDLDAGFAVRDGRTGTGKDPAFIKLVRALNWKKPGLATERLPEVVEAVKNRRKHKPEISSLSVNIIGGMFHGSFVGMAKTMDKNYRVDLEKCKRCGTCLKVCPRGNIRIESDGPSWHHDCEACGACSQWCPQQAIRLQGGDVQYYHHPEVKLKDVLLRSCS